MIEDFLQNKLSSLLDQFIEVSPLPYLVLEAKDRHQWRHVNKKLHDQTQTNLLIIPNNLNASRTHIGFNNLTKLEFTMAEII